MKTTLSIFSFVLLLLDAFTVFGQTKTVNLFEKNNPGEWAFYTNEKGTAVGDVFAFDGKTLTCKGKPFGYLATKENYKNFNLSVEYRWPEGVKPTNSGVFLRLTEQPAETFLPKCFEVQLGHGRAGDLWGFHGRTLKAPAGAEDRFSAKNGGAISGEQQGVARLFGTENTPGEWNRLDILCSGGLIVIVMNGKIVNWTTDAETAEGKIGFQSEGGPVEFRNASLTVLP